METAGPHLSQESHAPLTPPFQKSKSRSFLFLTIFTIIVSITGGMLFYTAAQKTTLEKNQKKLQQQQKFIKQEVLSYKQSPQSGNATTKPVQWKIYQNNTHKFSLSYPNTQQMKEISYGLGVKGIEFRSAGTPASEPADFQLLIFPKSLGKTIGQDFSEYYSLSANTSKVVKDSYASQKFTKIRNRSLNSELSGTRLRAFDYKATSYPADPEEEAEIGIYIEIGTNILVVSTGEGSKAVFESMLTSFKYPLKSS